MHSTPLNNTNFSPSVLHLTKHHGLGNDFLVLATEDPGLEAGAELARAVCDRHRGIGADGLLLALPVEADGAQIRMRLHNADGSVAEMSGNGIRCFVQACSRVGLVEAGEVRVQTDAGLRVVQLGADDPSGLAMVRVDMGVARVDAIAVPRLVPVAEGTSRQTVDIGNPHIVYLGSVGGGQPPGYGSIGVFGPDVEQHFDAGINVEVVFPKAADAIDMVVWERGVGITEACGTGACASAVAWRGAGGGADSVVVHQPGGDATVEMSGPTHAPSVVLIGPTQYIATIEWPVSNWPVHTSIGPDRAPKGG